MDDFQSIYTGAEIYNDDEFPPESSSLYWAEFNEDKVGLVSQLEQDITWGRIRDEFSSHTLFGDGASPEDVK